MKTLHRYLLRQIVASLLLTGAVFTFVLLLGNVFREVLPLLLSRQTSFSLVAQAFGLLIPWILMFTLPMGMLTATLLVFGRFSADQELTAARASGVSLLSLTAPILVFSVLLCGVSALVNLEIAPRCRVAYNTLRATLKSAIANNLQLPERRFLDFPGYTVYVGKNRGKTLEQIMVWISNSETNLAMSIRAPHGSVELDQANQRLLVHLNEAKYVIAASGQAGTSARLTLSLKLDSLPKTALLPSLTDMTLRELQAEQRKVEQRLQMPLSKRKPTEAEKARRKRQPADMTEPIRVQIQKRIAFSFACFGFTLLAIPLGIRLHRRETNVGVAAALGLVVVYYSLIVLADSLTMRPEFAPHLLIWVPNFLFQSIGAVLLWRANRRI